MKTLPEIPVTDITGHALQSPFALRRIICVARNFFDHAIEMGHAPSTEPPFYFFKPLTALDLTPAFVLPAFSQEVHHELELVIALDQAPRRNTPEGLAQCICAFGLGLDMTARDVQQQAKAAGRPWDLAKGFDGAAKISTLVSGGLHDITQCGAMTLTCNGTVRQLGHWRHMTHDIPSLLQHIGQDLALGPGDLIYTGTPAGVAAVTAGDHLLGTLEGFPHALSVDVKAP